MTTGGKIGLSVFGTVMAIPFVIGAVFLKRDKP